MGPDLGPSVSACWLFGIPWPNWSVANTVVPIVVMYWAPGAAGTSPRPVAFVDVKLVSTIGCFCSFCPRFELLASFRVQCYRIRQNAFLDPRYSIIHGLDVCMAMIMPKEIIVILCTVWSNALCISVVSLWSNLTCTSTFPHSLFDSRRICHHAHVTVFNASLCHYQTSEQTRYNL